MSRRATEKTQLPRRRRRQRFELHGKRNTVVLQTGYGEGPFDEMYPHMLIEDVGQQVMPLGTRWTERSFSVDLVPASERFEGLLADAFEPGGREGLTDAACEFLRQTAQLCMHYGRAIYEIVYLRGDDGQVAELEFAYVPPRSISIDGDHYVQQVPKDLAEQWDVPSVIRGAVNDLMVLSPPIDGEAIRRTLRALAEVGRPQLPEFVERQMLGEEDVGYSAKDEILTKDLAIAEVSRDLGWDMRAMFAGKDTFLEYYTTVRRLRFERLLADFRSTLVEQLNRHLIQIGKVVGEDGQLTLKGLPGKDTVAAAEESLRLGKKNFNDLLEPFSH
jgi:hypothetical protein